MRVFCHPLFAPVLLTVVFLWGAALALFLLVAPGLRTPWVDSLLALCVGFDPAGRVYRLDTLILYLGQPPLFAAVVGALYATELREVLRRRAAKVVAAAAPLLFVSLGGLVLATGKVSAPGALPRPESVQAPFRQGSPAPEFTLTDHRGRPFRLADQRGQVVALSFFYANCRASCPVLLSRLAALGRRFGGEEVVLAAVTLDPARDGVPELAALARRWRLGPRWHLLTGDPAAVERVRAAYRVGARRFPDGEIAHENVIQLVDRRGRLGFVYRGLGHQDEQIARGLRALLVDRG